MKENVLKVMREECKYHGENAYELLWRFTKYEQISDGNKIELAAFLQRLVFFFNNLEKDINHLSTLKSEDWVELMKHYKDAYKNSD